MNKYEDYFRSFYGSFVRRMMTQSAYRYENPKTGEMFTFTRKGFYKKGGVVLVYKGKASAGPMEDYVFTDKEAAVKKSKEIGMNGDVHTTKLGDGTVVYIPAKTEQEFEKWYRDNKGQDS